MNGKTKTLLWAVGFIALLGISTIAYRLLSDRVNPEDSLDIGRPTVSQEAPTASTTQNEPNATSAPDKRVKALDFAVTDSQGREVKLSSLFGKPIVLNFWASWCPPCKSEMPEFNEVYADLGDEVTFMMINATDGQRETQASGSAYVQSKGFTFPVYYDTVGQQAAATYAITSLPTTLFIDKDGYIVTGALGMISKDSLLEGIDMIQ